MPIKSRWPSISIPNCHIASLVFKSPTYPLSDTQPLFIDVENPQTRYLTPHSYRLYAQRLACGLQRNGFKKGDRLLLFSGNNILVPMVIMGVVMAGGIFTGANPAYVARELAHQLRDSDATFLLCARPNLEVALNAASHAGFPNSRVYVFDDHAGNGTSESGCSHWSSLLGSVEEGRRFEWNPCTEPGESDQTVALNYSSGTTGLPKGVEITHRNYVANCLQSKSNFDRRKGAEEDLKTERWLCFLPMYHAMAQKNFAVLAPLLGIPTFIMPRFEFEKMLAAVAAFRITQLLLVPPIVVAMVKHPDVRKGKWDLSFVRSAVCGAAPLGREVIKEFESLWKDGVVNIKQGWGMTEMTCIGTAPDPNRVPDSNSVGELIPNVEARLMNEDGTAEVPRGERGEVWLRGPNVMKGYWRNEKATRETLTSDGYLKTGDIAYVDEHGSFFIVDRRKELIKVKGAQVAPAELEALLLDHPSVADAAVIGVPHGEDEAPRAYIVLASSVNVSAEDVIGWVERRVSRNKRLEGGVRFVDTIPKNPSGKILRKLLREKAAAERQGGRARL